MTPFQISLPLYTQECDQCSNWALPQGKVNTQHLIVSNPFFLATYVPGQLLYLFRPHQTPCLPSDLACWSLACVCPLYSPEHPVPVCLQQEQSDCAGVLHLAWAPAPFHVEGGNGIKTYAGCWQCQLQSKASVTAGFPRFKPSGWLALFSVIMVLGTCLC